MSNFFSNSRQPQIHASGLLLALLVLAAILLLSQLESRTTGQVISGAGAPVLSSCSGSPTLFPLDTTTFAEQLVHNLSLKDPVDLWSERYHQTVSKIIDKHLENESIVCTEESALQPPGPDLKLLASQLPPWQDPVRLKELSENDVSAVLLEYLRVYECTLKEHEFYLIKRAADRMTVDEQVNISSIFNEQTSQRKKLEEEIALSRPTLDRTLSLIGGIDRLRPVDSSFECLQRASLDIRNILGLTAEVTSCLPRIYDTRGSLRDLP